MKTVKKLNLRLVGADGNAYALMGLFQSEARKAKWSKADIDNVLEDCMSGSYEHLLNVLVNL